MSEVLGRELIAATSKFENSQKAFMAAIVFTLEIEVLSKADNKVKSLVEEFEENTKKLDLSLRSYFRSNLFASLISSLEILFQESIVAVIRAHPKKIGSTQFKLIDFLEAESRDTIIQRAAEEYLNKIMYKKPAEYLDEIADILSIEKEIFQSNWPTFIEAKARRDIGIHNNWICNETYLRKVKEAGLQTELKIGDKVAPTNSEYLFSVSSAMAEIAGAMQAAVIKKYT